MSCVVQPDHWQPAAGHVALEGDRHPVGTQWQPIGQAEDKIVIVVVDAEELALSLLSLSVTGKCPLRWRRGEPSGAPCATWASSAPLPHGG